MINLLKESILDTIGNTPLVRLKRLEKELGLKGELYAKIEYYSPGLSKKDRIAKYIIEKAIKEKKLKKEKGEFMYNWFTLLYTLEINTAL